MLKNGGAAMNYVDSLMSALVSYSRRPEQGVVWTWSQLLRLLFKSPESKQIRCSARYHFWNYLLKFREQSPPHQTHRVCLPQWAFLLPSCKNLWRLLICPKHTLLPNTCLFSFSPSFVSLFPFAMREKVVYHMTWQPLICRVILVT